uniref:PadR family transcriptional regulator n=1 Tax=Ignisphaera aggregans TaxID=334771 RepID=A0A7J2U390_9CREN
MWYERRSVRVFVRDYVMLKILELLSKENMHGYRIMKELEKLFDVRLSPGVIYPILRNMVDMGLISASEPSTGGRRVVVYEITQEGREYLESNRRALESFDKKFSRLKECGLIEFMKRVGEVMRNIDRFSDEDVDKLRRSVENFLKEISSLGVSR